MKCWRAAKKRGMGRTEPHELKARRRHRLKGETAFQIFVKNPFEIDSSRLFPKGISQGDIVLCP